MNETLKTIAERYSCRDFADTPLTQEQADAIANAALAAPSAMNRQPWHVTLVTDKAFIDELDAEGMNILSSAEDKSGYERILSRGGKIFYNAPCMVIITNDGSAFAAVDSGILCQNVALAAHSLGLGSVICGMAGIPLGGPRAQEIRQRLRFPEDYSFCIAILIGTPKSGKTPHELCMDKLTRI